MRRVSVQSDSMIGLELKPAQDVELHLVDETGRRVKRRYTIRAVRPETGELDLDVALHGPGAGAAWGATAAPGDAISFQGPRGKLEVRPAPTQLLVGDESALPAIAVIAESLPADERAVAVIEVEDASEEQPVRGQVVRWVHREGSAPGTPDHLLPAVRDLLPSLDVTGTRAYLLGETRTMVALRAVLEEAGVGTERRLAERAEGTAIFVKGYWNVGRPDRRAGRSPL